MTLPFTGITIPRRRFLIHGGLAVVGLELSRRNRVVGQQEAATGNRELVVHSETPANAEPQLSELIRSWITPTEQFYIRSHAPNPELDPETFELSIEGLVKRPLKLKLQQLRHEYSNRNVVATLTCAGNRREEHSRVKPVSGVPWAAGAIGNARWRGVPLADLLHRAGVLESARHVWFEGADEIQRDQSIIPFGASIPLEQAFRASQGVPGALIVHAMNGKPLTRDHGFPLRSVVPGYIGARSVKWLRKIVVSDRPSENHYMAGAYKLVTRGTSEEWQAAKPIETFPLNSVTCIPRSGDVLAPGRNTVRGYALAPGTPGSTISKVEVSTDRGGNWTEAHFLEEARPFCWRRWAADIRLSTGEHQILVRATDSSGALQPETVPWNLKGYLFNAWHRTPIRAQS